MKPIRLEMNAFGPYKNKTVVNFLELGDKKLFLITGPNGSGKSTLLDALCYALYGETSGSERSGDNMVSHFADEGAEVSIIFDFKIGKQTYQIKREPTHKTPSKRGAGLVEQKPSASLKKKNSDGTWVVLTEKNIRECTEQIEEILGLKAEQFTQIMMLPQGKFQKFLSAGAKDRESILEALFKTTYYKRIEEALKKKAKEIKAELSASSTEVTAHLKVCDVENKEELEDKIKKVAEEKTEKEKQTDKAKEYALLTGERLKKAEADEKSFLEADKALIEFKDLSSQKKDIDKKTQSAKKADKANTFKGFEKALTDKYSREETTKEKLQSSLEYLKEAEIKNTKAQAELKKAHSTEKAIAESRKTADTLMDKLPLLKEYDEVSKSLEEAELNRKELENKAKEIEQKTNTNDKETKKLGVLRIQAENALKKLPEAIKAKEIEEKRLEAFEKLVGLQEQSKTEGQAVKVLANNVKRFEKTIRKLEENYKKVQKLRDLNLATALASGLKKGSPCPVCGSASHPNPAKNKGAEKEIDLSALDTELKEVRNNRDSEIKILASLEKKFSKLENQIETEEAKISEDKQVASPSAKKFTELERDLEDFEKISNEGAPAIKRINELEKQNTKLKNESKIFGNNLSRIEQEVSSVETKIKIIKKRFSGAMPKLSALEAMIEKNEAKADRLEALLEEARESDKEASADLKAATQQRESSEAELKKAKALAKKESEIFVSKIKKDGFNNIADYKAAKMDESELKSLSKELEDYGKSLASAQTRNVRANAAIKNLKRPNLKKTKEEADAAQFDFETINDAFAEIKEIFKTLSKSLTNIKRIGKGMETLEKEYKITGHVADIASGENTLNLSFQRFVLAGFLDDVLLQASERLKIMSQGRFSINRKSGVSDGRSAGGLEIEINDTYTDTARPADNLSGGESFIASLALALGLSDVAQSYAGGLKMDAIFIDEGFGSLDSDTLDIAMKALSELQGDGRLVGIISHVQELKERIETRLEVRTGKSGSSISFVGV